MDNKFSWQTVSVRTGFGQRQIPVFLFEVTNAPIVVEGANTVNTFMVTLFDTGFALMTSPDLENIVADAPTLTDTAALFDLRVAGKGVLRASVRGTVFDVVEAPIGHTDDIDVPFRAAARAHGVVLVIAGVGLSINPITGAYDLTAAAAAGQLTAAYVPAKS